MPVEIAQLLVWIFTIYALLGLVFSPYFVVWGVNRLDENGRQGSWGFRILIVPGVILFWPLLAYRLIRGDSVPPVERNPHRGAAVDPVAAKDSQ